MSSWKIAAAQYAPLNASPAEHVAHHLEYIELAARQQCELLVFPSLSLLGCVERNKSLPAPPDEALLQPLTHAADTHHMTIIVGMPVEHNCRFVKGIAIFAPWLTSPLMFHKSHGACIARQRSAINVVDEQPEGGDIDPSFTLFTTSQCLNEPELHASTSRLQRFSHKYALAVLMANACGSSALWNESGQLIVRADCGSLLLTGLRTTEGWQGDIIPLR